MEDDRMEDVHFRKGRNFYPGEKNGCLHPSEGKINTFLLEKSNTKGALLPE